MANYKTEEEFAFSDKSKDAFGDYNKNNENQQSAENQPQQQESQQKENKKGKVKNVKKNKKCRKKGKFVLITASIVVLGVVGKIGYGHIQDAKQRKIDTKAVNGYLDSRQSDMEDIIDKGSAIEAMLNSNYKDLYEEYLKAYTLANYADKIDKMNIKHDIKEVLSSDLCIDITAPNYQEQFEGLFNAYWDLKNTKESQTIGSAEYIQFQRICNTLENTRAEVDKIISSDEVTDMKFNMYAVCLVGDYVSHNLDNDGKPFNAAKITGIKIVQNSDKTAFDLVFDYNGYEYTKHNIPVDEIKDVLFSTEDRLSGFSTINTILIGDKNDVAKSVDKVIYEDETVRVKI